MKRLIQPAVYIVASQCRGTIYTGVTSDLVQRISQHRDGAVKGFSARYDVGTLVWYELHLTMESAITREKAIKNWNRAWKLRLIEEGNSEWRDLWVEIIGGEDVTLNHEDQNGFPRDQPFGC